MSVDVQTHNRPEGMAVLVATLRAQDLTHERFEVVVVDDGSEPPARVEAGDLALRVVPHERPRGPAAARNSGWRAARAPLVAFVDDDCVPVRGWLAALLEAARGGGDCAVQGPVAPAPDQRGRLGPLSHTVEVDGPTRLFVSCNIAYSRALLKRTGGFDETFKRACGEDAELGARVTAAGAELRFAPAALVHHEVRRLGLVGMLRHTVKWTDSVRVLAMHPELRELLTARVFWRPSHPRLLLALAALASRRPLVAGLGAGLYLSHYRRRYGGDAATAARALPAHVAIDLCEIATAVAGSIRHRTLMI